MKIFEFETLPRLVLEIDPDFPDLPMVDSFNPAERVDYIICPSRWKNQQLNPLSIRKLFLDSFSHLQKTKIIQVPSEVMEIALSIAIDCRLRGKLSDLRRIQVTTRSGELSETVYELESS